MQTRPPQMPQPERALTAAPVGSFRHDPGPGEFTPEVSPLGQLIYRGRMLKKELQHTAERDAPPSAEPHLERPAYPTPTGEEQGFRLRSDSSVSQRTEVPPTPRPEPVEMRMPRFSTITNDSYDDRDSMYSNDRDSTIMGAFSFGFSGVQTAGPPDIQTAPKAVRQEFHEGRDSIRPTIGHSQLEEELQQAPQPQTAKAEFNPVRESVKPVFGSVDDLDNDMEEISPTGTRSHFPAEAAPGTDGRMRGRYEGERPQRDPSAPGGGLGTGGPGFVPGGRPAPLSMMPGGVRRGSPGPSGHPAYSRAQSQPGVRSQRQPPRRPSGDDYRQQPSPSVQPVPYAPRQYQPYRQDAASPSGFAPPPRQSSAENGRFPPPLRTGSGNSDRLIPVRTDSRNSERLIPVRTDSRGSDTHFGPPSRQNSSELEKVRYAPYWQGPAGALPARQNSLETGGDRGYPRNSPSPQPPSILPMISDERVATPDSQANVQPGLVSPLYSPNPWKMERSPSAASDVNSIYTIGGTQKPALNFSRPLGGRPSTDSQHRPFIDTSMQRDQGPLLHGEQSDNAQEGPAPTYVYTKFDLPRGRSVGRDSVVFQDSHPGAESQQQQQQQQQDRGARPQGPHPGPLMSPSPPKSTMLSPPPRLLPAPTPGSPRLDSRGPGTTTPTGPPPRSPRLPPSPSAVMTEDEHLSKGIELHEKGALQESTYHLRCAAHGGHPTGMLLYALACRHGWGMRPNQREGVEWLKKVTQLASSEVADDEKGVVNVPFIEKQGRRAQFALSIYELGVSHLNGWGTEMDKGLALNCFEIAGSKLLSSLAFHPGRFVALIANCWLPQNGETQTHSRRPASAGPTESDAGRT